MKGNELTIAAPLSAPGAVALAVGLFTRRKLIALARAAAVAADLNGLQKRLR